MSAAPSFEVVFDQDDWEDRTPTKFYPRVVPPVPETPIPLVRGNRREPLLVLEYRDLLIAAPWAFSVGVLAGRLGLSIAVAGMVGAAVGLAFDRLMRRWI